jgi:phospholipid/cholesterol/gamma-HCH transport system substrate-binding protein
MASTQGIAYRKERTSMPFSKGPAVKLRNTLRPAGLGTSLCLLLGFAAIVYLTMQSLGSGWRFSRPSDTYPLTAKFDNIGGLKVQAPVKMGGVRIGRVESIGCDPIDYKAVVTLGMERSFDRIPQDSEAAIQTSGLLGGNYVGITPGGSDIFLLPATRIESTRSAFNLEATVNKLLAVISGK